jgi:site-specific recombinase XerD
MIAEHFFHRRDALKRLENNILCSDLEDFIFYLSNRGHTSKTINLYVRTVTHFGRWLEKRKIDPCSITDGTVSLFLFKHLPKCHCIPHGIRSLKESRPALRYLLDALRKNGRIPFSHPPKLTVIDRELIEFKTYLSTTCGLAEQTVLYRLRYAREFLLAKYGNCCVKFFDIEPCDITDFVCKRAKNYKSGSTKVLACSIRSYLRFLCLSEKCQRDLSNAVPTSMVWRQSHIPRTLNDEQLNIFFSAFDRSTSTGSRDYAICLCLSELGLRAIEVAALRFDDIDWREGTVQVPITKTRRSRLLPLPKRLGQAIVHYICKGRPKSKDRHIFLRHVAPKDSPIGPHIVQNAVAGACSRVQLEKYSASPHTFRHTIASRMNERGASFKEIADVLGHQQIDTVSIYAKVNLRQLSNVALPWPEVRS